MKKIIVRKLEKLEVRSDYTKWSTNIPGLFVFVKQIGWGKFDFEIPKNQTDLVGDWIVIRMKDKINGNYYGFYSITYKRGLKTKYEYWGTEFNN